MFRNGFDFKVHDSINDINGRFIILDISIYDQRLTMVCLYGHNTDTPEFFSDILNKCVKFSNSSILLCGDWNVVQRKCDYTFYVLNDRKPKARKR